MTLQISFVALMLDALEDEVPLQVMLFELLWKCRARVHIPDTLTYKYGKLESWYFNSKDSKSSPRKGPLPLVKRKRDSKIKSSDVTDRIIEAFCTGKQEQDIVALWVNAEPKENCKLLYLTRANFSFFLCNSPRHGHGVLQRWVAPFGGHNSHLRTDWSPHHLSLEQRTNWYSVGDQKHPVAQRLATFEGGVRNVSSASVINQHLRARVSEVSAHIAEMFDREHNYRTKVFRQLCTWKPAEDGLVYLLWCSVLEAPPSDPSNVRFLPLDEGAAPPSAAPTTLGAPPLLRQPSSVAQFACSPASLAGQPDSYATLEDEEAGARLRVGRRARPSKRTAPVAYSLPTMMRNGVRKPMDGSIFHIPAVGMSTYAEPEWWHAERIPGMTAPLDDDPFGLRGAKAAQDIGHQWRVEPLQRAIYQPRSARDCAPHRGRQRRRLRPDVDAEVTAAIERSESELAACAAGDARAQVSASASGAVGKSSMPGGAASSRMLPLPPLASPRGKASGKASGAASARTVPVAVPRYAARAGASENVELQLPPLAMPRSMARAVNAVAPLLHAKQL
jgi:hypothetical protein